MASVKRSRDETNAATRAALITCGTQLFAERGYSETSVDDVAAAAGMTKGAVYHQFATKAALFEAIFHAHEVEVHGRLATALDAAADAESGARAALEVFFAACCEPGYGTIVFRDGPIALGWSRWRECEIDYAYAFITRVLTALEEQGRLAQPLTETQPTVVLGMLSSAGQLLGQAQPTEQHRLHDELADLFDQMLVALATPPPRTLDRP